MNVIEIETWQLLIWVCGYIADKSTYIACRKQKENHLNERDNYNTFNKKAKLKDRKYHNGY